MNELELLRRIQDLERRAERQESHGHGVAGNWTPVAAAWTRTADTTFTVAGNVTALFPVGAKIKVVDTTTKYFYVVSAAYTTLTTVTITGGSDYVLAANPTAGWISYASSPQGFPQWFNFSTVLSASSGAFTTAASSMQFAVIGKTCHFEGYVAITTNGTAVGVKLTLPITSAAGSIVCGREYAVTGDMLQGVVSATSTTLTIYAYEGSNINGNGRSMLITGFYPI